MTGRAIETLLGEHQWTWRMFQERPQMACTCGSKLVHVTSSRSAGLEDHRAHLADVIRTATLAALADAEHLTDREKALFAETLREVWG